MKRKMLSIQFRIQDRYDNNNKKTASHVVVAEKYANITFPPYTKILPTIARIACKLTAPHLNAHKRAALLKANIIGDTLMCSVNFSVRMENCT